MVGNGVTDGNYDNFYNSLLPFIAGHGLISNRTYLDLLTFCDASHYDKQKCDAAMHKVSSNMGDIDVWFLGTLLELTDK